MEFSGVIYQPHHTSHFPTSGNHPIMKLLTHTILATLSVTLSSLALKPAVASTIFDQKEVRQSDFVLMATPYQGGDLHRLTVIGQLSGKRPCWNQQGQQPAVITPLLLNFNFNGICMRGVDSNGYSIRIDGQDQYVKYSPEIISENNELQLIAKPSRAGRPSIIIARSHGPAESFSQLKFEPGWRITQRTYKGRKLGHLYLTNDNSLASLVPFEVDNRDNRSNQFDNAYNNQVEAIYREVVGTTVDADTSKSYAHLLSSGVSLNLVRADIINRDETTQALNQLYQRILGKSGSPAMLRSHRQRMKDGWSLAEVEWHLMKGERLSEAQQVSGL